MRGAARTIWSSTPSSCASTASSSGRGLAMRVIDTLSQPPAGRLSGCPGRNTADAVLAVAEPAAALAHGLLSLRPMRKPRALPGAMRMPAGLSQNAPVTLAAAMTLGASTASADGTTTTTTGEGTCTGTIGTKMLSGKTALAIGKDPSSRLTILAQRASTVFGKAECECRSRDIYLRVTLDSAGL